MYNGYSYYAQIPEIIPTLSGSNPGDFAVTPAQPFSNLSFTFTPTAAGPRSAKVKFDNGDDGYILLQGTGIGPGPSFRVSQNSLSLYIHLPSSPDPYSIGSDNSNGPPILTVTNNGTTTLNIGATFTGAGAPYMSATSSNCTSLAPQAACSITINVDAPVGTYSTNLLLKDSNSSFAYPPIPISAKVDYWSIIASSPSLTFSSQAVGTTSAAQTVTILDPLRYPLIGHPLSVTLQPSSNFVLTQGSTCPASSTTACRFAIAFAPQVSGTISETATITDQTSGFQTTLALTGVAGTVEYSLSPSAVTFPVRSINTTSIPMTVTLTSNGTQTVNVSNISISGAVNGNFTQTNDCSSVPADTSCSINITFAPTATGTQSATLQIMSNATGSQTTISISGSAQ